MPNETEIDAKKTISNNTNVDDWQVHQIISGNKIKTEVRVSNS